MRVAGWQYVSTRKRGCQTRSGTFQKWRMAGQKRCERAQAAAWRDERVSERPSCWCDARRSIRSDVPIGELDVISPNTPHTLLHTAAASNSSKRITINAHCTAHCTKLADNYPSLHTHISRCSNLTALLAFHHCCSADFVTSLPTASPCPPF